MLDHPNAMQGQEGVRRGPGRYPTSPCRNHQRETVQIYTLKESHTKLHYTSDLPHGLRFSRALVRAWVATSAAVGGVSPRRSGESPGRTSGAPARRRRCSARPAPTAAVAPPSPRCSRPTCSLPWRPSRPMTSRVTGLPGPLPEGTPCSAPSRSLGPRCGPPAPAGTPGTAAPSCPPAARP